MLNSLSEREQVSLPSLGNAKGFEQISSILKEVRNKP